MNLLPFDQYDFNTPRITKALNNASRTLGELKGFASFIDNEYFLLNAINISEAKDSSEIENIVTTHDSIYKVLTQNDFKDSNAKEVVNYRSAIWRGYELVKEKGFINTNVLVDIQSVIEHNNAGIRKTMGTNLLNSVTGEVIYTPPQTEDEIRLLLKNLEDYINYNEDDVDPLIKMTLIHYQFESIHPFYDGNGRTGRILNILYLVLNNLLTSPILYLSNYINRNKLDYYKYLDSFRRDDNYEDWVVFILNGVEETSLKTIELIKSILDEINNFSYELQLKLPKIYSDELIKCLFYEAYTKISYVEKSCGVTRQTASVYLNKLVDVGLLESEKIGREVIYKNTRLINILKEFK